LDVHNSEADPGGSKGWGIKVVDDCVGRIVLKISQSLKRVVLNPITWIVIATAKLPLMHIYTSQLILC